ncbi:MAG: VPLPA-CTERM-specific exosortase XrtD [Gammaproteobacteria bacterium]|nr:VPLPA-CTERM-specific exosortase XrtD [Gammaproteobacteria bacterium]
MTGSEIILPGTASGLSDAQRKRLVWVITIVSLLLVGFAFSAGLSRLVDRWINDEEYGHGFLLLIVALYFLWLRIPLIRSEPWRPSWHGPVIVLLAYIVFLVGQLSAIYPLVHYAALLLLLGLGISMLGLRTARHLIVPLTVLLFAIPFPADIQAGLTAKLQLVSSSLGVLFIRLWGIPVFLEGNVIDLGVYKLQVVEACSGLRYMFSLASLGFIAACLFRAALWKRIVLVVSTLPITILMNSLRIGIVGLLVNSHGIEMADGFNHEFEGFSIFGACLVILFAEIWLLARIGADRGKLFEVFGLERRVKLPPATATPRLMPLLCCLYLSLGVVVAGNAIERRNEVVPARSPLMFFPGTLEDWSGVSYPLEPEVLDSLKLSEYLMVDYSSVDSAAPVNVYMGWYESQRMGAAPHSPRVCIPGGGWEITEFSPAELPFSPASAPLHYNRVIIRKGENRQLVYYWFQGRGRSISNEYLMKWYLLVDALLENRSDGALIRLTTPVVASEPVENADRRLVNLAYLILPQLPAFVPD